ncbi:MAG: alpha-galactosidase [Deltaproteobacteria bacterium]|nr:alpha-galactosidase [Deltaproteobacteria bacterium]
MVTVLGREGSSLLAGLFPVDDRCGDLLLERVAGAWSLAARIHLDGRRLGPGQALRAGGVLLAAGPEGAPLLDAWADALAPRNPSLQARREKLLASVGWCTWYCHGRGIREETLREVTDHVVARPGLEAIRLVQLDDGYQRRIGDWLQPAAAFPSGLAAAVRGIRERGFDAGLWLTPLIAEPRSELFRSHPDWFLVDQEGNPVSGGWNPLWRTRFHALDCTRPQVRGWLAELFRRLRDLGVSFFKLDYLYPAAFPARRHNPDISRGGALRLGLEAIREAVGDDAMLLGCGAPLGPCRGLVDAMRISPDVAPFWRMRGPIPRLLGEDELHGRYASLRQTLARAFLHDRWWVNDPDVLLLQGAPAHEIRAQAAVIAASGGLLLLGDDPRRLGEVDLSLLQRVLSLRRRAGDCPDAVARTDPGILCPRGDAAGSVVRVNLGDSGAEIGGQTLPPRTAAWSDDP